MQQNDFKPGDKVSILYSPYANLDKNGDDVKEGIVWGILEEGNYLVYPVCDEMRTCPNDNDLVTINESFLVIEDAK